MEKTTLYCYLLLVVTSVSISTTALAKDLEKRVLPINENCNPVGGNCLKGDWLSKSVADCSFDRSFFHPISCTPRDDSLLHWVVEPETNGNCIPQSDKPIRCGDSGTNTRCVCSSPKLPFNECRCQYWPELTSGESQNAFCTAYYISAGDSGLHHYACCANCNDPDTSCDGQTWQGGTSNSYCSTCGTATGGGVDKYYFNCGNCQMQSSCKDRCDNAFPVATWPGFCWRWVDCFAGCCRESTTQYARRRRQTLEFCGDGICQQSNENPDSCPTDCCYLRNSTCGTTMCTKECCQTATCCSGAALSSGSCLLALLVLMHVVSFVIN